MAQPDPSARRALIVETAAGLLGCRADVWLTGAPSRAAGQPEPADRPQSSEPPTTLMRRAFDEQRILSSDQIELAPAPKRHGRKPVGANGGNGRALAVAIPLATHAARLGVLHVERPNGPPFADAEIETLDGLATQSALALQTAYQMSIERHRVEQLMLVRQVSAQIANLLDLDDLARRVAQLILGTFDYYFVAVFTLDPGQDSLCFRHSAGPRRPADSPAQESPLPIDVRLGEGIIGLAAQSGQEILSNDVVHEPRYRHIDLLPETQSEVALPLKIETRVLGVLDVQSNLPNAFHETDMLVLRALADNIAVAVEGARLYDDLRQRTRQLSSVAEVSNAIASILDTDRLLDEVVSLIHQRLGYPFVQLFTVNLGLRKILYRAGSIPLTQDFKLEEFGYDLDDPQGLIPWVARHAQTVVANDVRAEPRYRRSENLFQLDAQAEMVVPMLFGDEVLGVLDVQSDRRDAFSADERFLFEALADTIAVALRNAKLYRSEQWRRQVADGMREVAGLLSTEADLGCLLDAILGRLEQLLPCDVAAIWLLEEPGSEDDLPPLRLAAVHCLDTPQCAADLLQDYSLAAEETRWQPGPWLAAALSAEEPIIRNRETPFEPLGWALDFDPGYSAIASPLRASEHPLGVLILAHHTPGRYGGEAQSMTATFASYAAVAIENARLYEASHEQAWIATVLLQVAEATQSITDITELLATVVQIAPMVVGVGACAILMWDAHTESFMPSAAHGFNPQQQDEFPHLKIAAGEHPAFDQLRLTRRAVLLHGAESGGMGAPGWGLFQSPSLVLFPLMARGELLGAFMVDFETSQAEAAEVDFLHDEKLAVIQGIAQQTAIAIENIRLLKSQKEEAYVSVALLQVAQAVVSLNELGDILEAIVRISPILVGVTRCAIYLWDDERSLFHLSKSYGIAAEDEAVLTAGVYQSGKFPLLDAVRRGDRVVFYPLQEPPESPLDWDRLLPYETSLILETLPEEFSEADLAQEIYHNELLRSEARLLLAIPLSVKGNVLGVMIAEEAEATADEPSHHIRERRLEIITGISQQASLAIQNDLLQREVVERERLEREMQLAREIQKAFLPSRFPKLPGWDLDVRWRPARQVGGDFYDVIDLPGGQVGLVIADVADKGMPAALFMTLVRTLIRAEIHEAGSPATVLERVNNLLIPDTQQGMFITVFYAVLSANTGELVYANAGHNLPLVYRRKEKRVERLLKGGMALGIQENIRIPEHTARLDVGDFVVFYTDGVTEAFSPEGEMYGEERLCETLRTFKGKSAKSLLDAVDESVFAFTGEGFPSDDLTLIGLQRRK